MKAVVVALLAVVSLAGGCQGGDSWGMTDSIRRAMAHREVAKGCDLSADGKDQAASAAFEKAVAYDPRNALAQANLGRISAAAGRYEEAVQHYQAAVRHAPDSAEYAFALASCLDRLAETSIDRPQTLDRAVRAYAHVRWLDPTNLEAAIRMGACDRQLGNYEEAIRVLREAEEIDSASARVHNELAATYEELGDCNRALAEYTQALKIEPDNLTAHNGCGEVNLTLSRRAGPDHPLARRRAIAHLRRSLEIEAAQPRIKALLAQLEPSETEMADAGE